MNRLISPAETPATADDILSLWQNTFVELDTIRRHIPSQAVISAELDAAIDAETEHRLTEMEDDAPLNILDMLQPQRIVTLTEMWQDNDIITRRRNALSSHLARYRARQIGTMLLGREVAARREDGKDFDSLRNGEFRAGGSRRSEIVAPFAEVFLGSGKLLLQDKTGKNNQPLVPLFNPDGKQRVQAVKFEIV